MKKILQNLLFLTLFLLIVSCSSDYNQRFEDTNAQTSEASSECKFEDGTYSATVEYYNSETEYSATYTLDVEVENGQIVQIDFPNGGWVDEDHITAADLDENGFANVSGEDGKSYQVQIEN